MEKEDIFRQSTRRLGAIALILYAFGILIVILGVIVFVSILVSTLSKYIPPGIILIGIHIPSDVIRSMIGVALILVGSMFYIIFSLYAGFMGRSVVSKIDLRGWGGLIKVLAILNFIAMLFITIGIFNISMSSFIYRAFTMILISSILILVCAFLIPLQHLIEAGILLIIAGILAIVAESTNISVLGPLASFSTIGALFTGGVLPNVALIIVGVAITIRPMTLKWPISHIIASVGGIIYATNIAYTYFSIILSLPTHVPTGFSILYYSIITGGSLVGVAGILGIIALILAIVFAVMRS
jgi:hypothetical protein